MSYGILAKMFSVKTFNLPTSSFLSDGFISVKSSCACVLIIKFNAASMNYNKKNF